MKPGTKICVFLAALAFAVMLLIRDSTLVNRAHVTTTAKEPGLWSALVTWFEQRRIDRARADIKALEQAMMTFLLKKGYYPEDLNVLAMPDPLDGSPALIPQAFLTDPWSRAYIYDPCGRRNEPPLIYSNGPKADGSLGRISNWD